MKLSVVIVNYNVRFFLEQCLQSVFGALKNITSEVFVVDNNSVDGSATMVKEKFPMVNLLINNKNIGFAAANNLAILKSTGEYVLLLNPDTVVEEDTFTKSLNYLEENPETGALGVKMIDGKGHFLPESKRGLPTPWVSFYKVFGLSGIFPKSKKFGKYHLSFLDKNQTHKVDVLCGAFMLMRRVALEKAGLLDESFFMYGEDIDLSYRISKAGFSLVYFPETTIIHYKGESTKKGSLNYVYLFYKAMQIFAKKHFVHGGASWFYRIIQVAIVFRASLAVAKRFGLALLLPLLDIALMFTGILFLAKFWGSVWFSNPNYYSPEFFTTMVPGFLAILALALLFTGAYDFPVKLKNVFTGIFAGTAFALILYALLPKDYQYSRMLLVSGALLGLGVALINRYVLSAIGLRRFSLRKNQHKRILIVGEENESRRVESILKTTGIQTNFIAHLSISSEIDNNIQELPEMVRVHKANEIIFCLKNIQASAIISYMHTMAKSGCDFKIAPSGSDSIIGSNSIHSSGDLYVYNANPVVISKNIRLKRTFDIAASVLLFLTIPLWLWFKKPRAQFLKNIFIVLLGCKTWIGYSISHGTLKPGVFSVADAFPESKNNSDIIAKLELAYTQDYKISNDIAIFIKAFRAI